MPATQASGIQFTSGTYDYTEAPQHIGETATIVGTPVDIYTSKTDTTFFDYCSQYTSCPFSAVIFADDKAKFGDLSRYSGAEIA